MQEVTDTEYEPLICGMYGVDREDLVNTGRRRRHGRVTECLHLIVYFLHYKGSMSIRGIARLYSMTPRNVSYIASKMRYGISTQSYYRDMAERVEAAAAEMKKAASDNADTAFGKKESEIS